MRATIDAAGRVVVPKQMRMDVGMVAGEVEIEVHGAGIRLALPRREGPRMTTEELREFRLSLQR